MVTGSDGLPNIPVMTRARMRGRVKCGTHHHPSPDPRRASMQSASGASVRHVLGSVSPALSASATADVRASSASLMRNRNTRSSCAWSWSTSSSNRWCSGGSWTWSICYDAVISATQAKTSADRIIIARNMRHHADAARMPHHLFRVRTTTEAAFGRRPHAWTVAAPLIGREGHLSRAPCADGTPSDHGSFPAHNHPTGNLRRDASLATRFKSWVTT